MRSGSFFVFVVHNSQDSLSSAAAVTEGCGQTQPNIRIGKWHIYLGNATPEDVGNDERQKGKERQREHAPVFKTVQGGESSGACMGDQTG